MRCCRLATQQRMRTREGQIVGAGVPRGDHVSSPVCSRGGERGGVGAQALDTWTTVGREAEEEVQVQQPPWRLPQRLLQVTMLRATLERRR